MAATESVTPRLVTAIDAAWSAIRARHPEVPEVVVTLGSGISGRGRGKYGHFQNGVWQRGDGRLPELFVGGEGLQRGAVPLLGTLLHEGVHGLAAARGVADTSRQGRYHNTRFRDLAHSFGIEVEHDSSFGWAMTSVPASTAAAYAREVERLEAALVAFRHPDGRGRSRASSNNGVSARCPCGRRIRVAESVLADAPITCGACGGDFE